MIKLSSDSITLKFEKMLHTMTSDISGTSLCCKGRANQASKTETQAATVRVTCVTCSAHVLIFAVIGHYTINILKIFQMFTVFMSLTVKI